MPVAAVVKADGYGWGAGRLAFMLDDIVDSYFVADVDEFRRLRACTVLPIRLLGDVPDDALEEILRAGGIPNISTVEALRNVLRIQGTLRAPLIRLGTLRAAGWSTPNDSEWEAMQNALAGCSVGVELWTHVVSPDRVEATERDLLARKAALELRKVRVVSLDVSSTGALGMKAAQGMVRVGAGLFGARLGGAMQNRCAITYCAPIARRYRAGEMPRAGYGNTAIDTDISVVRAGYADGITQSAMGSGPIISVGMQYTTLRGWMLGPSYRFLDDESDLDALAAAWKLSPHELIVNLSRAALKGRRLTSKMRPYAFGGPSGPCGTVRGP